MVLPDGVTGAPAIFRLPAAQYREMGARNRIEAVVRACDKAWI